MPEAAWPVLGEPTTPDNRPKHRFAMRIVDWSEPGRQEHSRLELSAPVDRTPLLEHRKLEFPAFAHGGGLAAPPESCNAIGTLCPMVSCGRSSLQQRRQASNFSRASARLGNQCALRLGQGSQSARTRPSNASGPGLGASGAVPEAPAFVAGLDELGVYGTVSEDPTVGITGRSREGRGPPDCPGRSSRRPTWAWR